MSRRMNDRGQLTAVGWIVRSALTESRTPLFRIQPRLTKKTPGDAVASPRASTCQTLGREGPTTRRYLQAGSPSAAAVPTTGFVVLMPMPHENGAGIWVWVVVADQKPAPVAMIGRGDAGRALILQVRNRPRVLRAVREERLFRG